MNEENSYSRMMATCAERGVGRRPGEVARHLTDRGLLTKPSTISNWKLRGGVPPAALVQVAEIIGVEVHWLMHGGTKRASVRDPFPNVASPNNGVAVPHISIAEIIDYYACLSREDRHMLRSMLGVVDQHSGAAITAAIEATVGRTHHREKVGPVKKAVPSSHANP